MITDHLNMRRSRSRRSARPSSANIRWPRNPGPNSLAPDHALVSSVNGRSRTIPSRTIPSRKVVPIRREVVADATAPVVVGAAVLVADVVLRVDAHTAKVCAVVLAVAAGGVRADVADEVYNKTSVKPVTVSDIDWLSQTCVVGSSVDGAVPGPSDG